MHVWSDTMVLQDKVNYVSIGSIERDPEAGKTTLTL